MVEGWEHLDRWGSRCSVFPLVLTIDTGRNDIDIYTPVASAIANLAAKVKIC